MPVRAERLRGVARCIRNYEYGHRLQPPNGARICDVMRACERRDHLPGRHQRCGLLARVIRWRAAAVALAAAAVAGCASQESQPHPATPSAPATEVKTIGDRWPDGRRRPHRRPKPAAEKPPAATPADIEPPKIVDRPIPFPSRRRQEMAAYSQRHYGQAEWRLVHPQVIVEHYTASSSFESAYNTFAQDVPDVELHELPGLCSHFIVDRDGTIYRLVPITIRCRHTVGLNYTSIGIEHVGTSDQQVMGDAAQLQASLKLTSWLRCSHDIKVRNVIGHSESLSSPFHHENVASLRSQTHGDMTAATMAHYRELLAAQGC
jgi:N-acetylmuramoyl-L-alanine amidase